MIELINTRTTEITALNRVTEPKEIEIDTIHEFGVNYAEDGKHCRAKIKLGIMEKGNPEQLKMICTVEGDFNISEINSDEDKKAVHIECYKFIFPYAQSLLARICVDLSLPAFYYPELQMSVSDVIISK